MTFTIVVLAAALWVTPEGAAGTQTESVTPRSTTERPNVSAPGLEQTLSGVLMDASCSAIADGRSELTRTPRILPPRNNPASPLRSAERQRAEQSHTTAVPEDAVPDRFRSCRVKPSTTSFGFYVNGKVYVLDSISNQMMQEHMLKAATGETNRSGWTSRILVGTATSDDVLTVRSIRK